MVSMFLYSTCICAAENVQFNAVVLQKGQFFHIEQRPRYIFGDVLALELTFPDTNARNRLIFSASTKSRNLHSDINLSANGSRRGLLFIYGLNVGKTMLTVCGQSLTLREQICRQLPVIRVE